MTASGHWEQRAWQTIRPIVDANPDASEKQLRKLLRQAYPFGERGGWPYKVWLRCVSATIAARPRQRAWRGGGGE
jgi:hypothetical protein